MDIVRCTVTSTILMQESLQNYYYLNTCVRASLGMGGIWRVFVSALFLLENENEYQDLWLVFFLVSISYRNTNP